MMSNTQMPGSQPMQQQQFQQQQQQQFQPMQQQQQFQQPQQQQAYGGGGGGMFPPQLNSYVQMPPTNQQMAFSPFGGAQGTNNSFANNNNNNNNSAASFSSSSILPPPPTSFYGAQTQVQPSFGSAFPSMPSYAAPPPPLNSFSSQLPPTLYSQSSSTQFNSQLPPPPFGVSSPAQPQNQQFVPLSMQQNSFQQPPSFQQPSYQQSFGQYPPGPGSLQQPQLQYPPQAQQPHSAIPSHQAYVPFPASNSSQPPLNGGLGLGAVGPGMFPPSSSSSSIQNFGVGIPSAQIENWVFELSGQKLDRKDLFSPSDPFLNIYAFRGNKKELIDEPNIPNSDSRWKMIHRTEVIKDDANPNWKPFVLDIGPLCDNDRLKPFLIDCYDYDDDGSHDFIGSCIVSLIDLQQTRKVKLQNAKRWGFGNVSGFLIVKKCDPIQK